MFQPIRGCLPGLAVLVSAPFFLAQVTGHLAVTNAQGMPESCFTSPSQVHFYLGPALTNCTTNPPVDGDYYFQVTDPSGVNLLSTDPLQDRRFSVRGGRIATGNGVHVTLNSAPCPSSRILSVAPFGMSVSAMCQYKLWVTPVWEYHLKPAGFHGFVPHRSLAQNFVVMKPVAQSTIRGFAFYDFDEDGTWQNQPGGEVPLAGWRVEIWRDEEFEDVTFTDATGRYEFMRPFDPAAIYEIREVPPSPGYIPEAGAIWLSTNARTGLVAAGQANVPGPDFGNVEFELAVGAGRTRGFWHNQGESLLLACDPDWREELNFTCLRRPISTANPSLSIFLVPEPPATFATAFAALSGWIVGQGAGGHAGYQLSAQVAAAILNNTCGFMQGSIYIDRMQNGQLVSLAQMFQDVSGLLCAPGAGLTGPGDPPQPSPIPGVDLRTAMLMCLNEFDSINNTGSTTEPQIVYKSRSTPSQFPSPYEP